MTGTNRFKYFSRQVFTGLNTLEETSTTLIPIGENRFVEEKFEEEGFRSRTIGIQTDYRESEAQTIPWDPDYSLPENPWDKQRYRSSRFHCAGPELLELRHLKFGTGLPAGLNEINHIDKLREKRAFEASLPSINNLKELDVRQNLIEKWEEKEWAERSTEIQDLQNQRLSILEEAIDCREEQRNQEIQSIVESRKSASVLKAQKSTAAVEKLRVRTVRHLSSLRKQARELHPFIKESLVQAYTNFGSQKYAPLQRLGQFPDNQPVGNTIVTEIFQPESLQEVRDLENYMKSSLRDIQTQTISKSLFSGGKGRKEAEVQKNLLTLSNELQKSTRLLGVGYGDCWLSPVCGTDESSTTKAKVQVTSEHVVSS